jgi:hypothetical protein
MAVSGGSPSFTTVTTTSDASISGLTVGKGGGAVSTNTAVGASALATNSTGTTSVAIGYQALTSNTTGTYNTAVGYQAGYTNTVGTGHASFGYQSGYLTTGNGNTLLGNSAGYYVTSGANNTYVGNNAGSNIAASTGSFNTGIGGGALVNNTTASNNTAVGYQAGYTGTTGADNTFVGTKAGYSKTTSNQNTFIGSSAGYYVTTGANNTVIGTYNGNQGSLDIRTSSNYIVLSDGDGNPRQYTNSSGFTKWGNNNNQEPSSTRYSFVSDVSDDVFEVRNTNASFGSAMIVALPTRNTTNGSFKTFSYYNIGASAFKFYVIDSGAIYSTSTSITSISDQRFKENIQDIDVGLAQVMALKPRRFDWKDGKGEDRKNAVGFIAQEVQDVLPDLVTNFEISEDDKTKYFGLRSQDLIPTLVKAIQELKAELDTVKAELAALKG